MTAHHSTLSLVLPLIALAACGSNRPFLQPVPGINPIPPFEVPPAEDLNSTITFAQAKTTPEELTAAVSTAAGFKLPANAKIVISVPIDDGPAEARILEATFTGSGLGITNFRTANYFNLAEQQIERTLLEKGIAVLDRSRFEAKLRDQRSTAAEPAADSHRRELFDIAQLIRAAVKEEPKADFVLQINTFKTEPLFDRHIDLNQQNEIRYLTAKNQGLEAAFAASEQTTITKPGYYGMLNAKLIEVSTGAIVWVGSHRVESLNILPGGLQVTVPVRKTVNNATVIQSIAERYNESLREMQSRAMQLADQLENDDLDDEEFDTLARSYNQQCQLLNAKQTSGRPDTEVLAWSYDYAIEPIKVDPELPTTELLDRLEIEWNGADDIDQKSRLMQRARRFKEFLNAHYAQLAKLVTKELISTIPGQ